MLDGVVSHHLDGFRSGVARFNELLASHLGVPLVSLLAADVQALHHPLLSFKVSELSDNEQGYVRDLLAHPSWESFDLFFHDYADVELEHELIAAARRVHCGNQEIFESVSARTSNGDVLWTPGLLLDDRAFAPVELSVFSFGMAHKIRVDEFERLHKLLEASRRTYAVYISTANHETALMRDAALVYEAMHEIFPEGLYFLGNLSDVAIFNALQYTTFFAAFFDGGLRGNNTSVAAAMERGAVVITNLDESSPPEFRHLENVIDINRCESLPEDPEVLAQISARAVETALERGWEQLVRQIRAE